MSLANSFLVFSVCCLLLFHLSHYVFIIDESLKTAHGSHVVEGEHILGFYGAVVLIGVDLENHNLKMKILLMIKVDQYPIQINFDDSYHGRCIQV